jgi:hypothetical protein
MKLSLQLLLLSTVTLLSVSAQQAPRTSQSETANQKKAADNTSQSKPFKLPEEIKLTLKVEEMPGIENPKSFWEGTYEIRLVDWSTIDERTKAGLDAGDAGVVFLQSSFEHRSLSDENRRLTVSLPVNGPLRERLLQQRENPQAFSLRSKVRFYDGQLDRNSAFSINRIWRFGNFPDGEATITIKIKPDGGFSVWGPLRKDAPASYTIIGNPATQKP